MMDDLPKTLMIISSDRISDWIEKGEVTARYFNPGEVFDTIHLVLLHQENPNPMALKKLVGKAQYHLHTFPTGIEHFVKTLAWNPWCLGVWARPIVELAQKTKPHLIRCHGAFLNAFVARQIHKQCGTPYVISLHINYDEDVRQRKMGMMKKIRDWAYRGFEYKVLKDASLLLPVYEPIVPYLTSRGLTHYKVAYNFLNTLSLKKKTDYKLHHPAQVISIGRQFKEKDPSHLIRAVGELPEVELTMVGDGLYHQRLKHLAVDLGLSNRVHFKPAIENDTLCKMLPDYDLFATHSEYWEISKSVLEPLLTGLPVLLNRRKGEPVPELTEDIVYFVENTPEGYKKGLMELLGHEPLRTKMGQAAYQKAQSLWAPEVTENRFRQLYLGLLEPQSET